MEYVLKHHQKCSTVKAFSAIFLCSMAGGVGVYYTENRRQQYSDVRVISISAFAQM